MRGCAAWGAPLLRRFANPRHHGLSPTPRPGPRDMSRKKISTTIYVTPEQSERLRLLHERTKVPAAVHIREGLDLVLRQYGHLLPGPLPLAREAATAPAAHSPRGGRVDGDTKAGAHRSDRGA